MKIKTKKRKSKNLLWFEKQQDLRKHQSKINQFKK